MTVNELAAALKAMYENALPDEQATMMHLFGIIYAQDIEEFQEREHKRVKDIMRTAEIKMGYQTDVRKGMKLARYVKPRADLDWKALGL